MEMHIKKMIKTLVVDDDLHFSKNMLNCVINKFKNIQVLYITTTYKECMDILYNNQIDLIFLDLLLPDNNGMQIIKELETMNVLQKTRIIVVSGDVNLISQLYAHDNICGVINKLESYDAMLSKIERTINKIDYENNFKKIEKFIYLEISNMGYNMKYKGTQYIIEAIIYIYERNNMDFVDNLEQNVYKYISYKHKKSINNIKTNIIKATNEIKREKDSLYKLTPKLSIITILNKIYQKYN